MDTSCICNHLIVWLTNLLIGHLSSSQDHVLLDHMVGHVLLSRAASQGHVPLFPVWLPDYNWALGWALLDLCVHLLVYVMAQASPVTLDEATLNAFPMRGLAPPSHLLLWAPPKCPASPLSPPQHPAPYAHGSPGFSPSLAPSPSLSCTCHSTSWASCRLHLTWDSFPLHTLPHTLSSASPPFIFLTALPLELKEQVSACDDCS